MIHSTPHVGILVTHDLAIKLKRHSKWSDESSLIAVCSHENIPIINDIH